MNKVLRKIKSLIRKFKNVYLKYTAYNYISKLEHINSFDNIIFFENNLGWNNIMKQRPQQIASNFKENTLFIYGSNEYLPNNLSFLKNNLLIVNLNIFRDLLIKLSSKKINKYLMLYSTSYVDDKIFNKYLKNNFKIIYEYVDDISIELSGKIAYKKLIKQFNNIIYNNNAYIICTATKLIDNISRLNPNAKCKLVTNGVVYEDFALDSYIIPDDMIDILKLDKPIIGYYGALANWFDYELIIKISESQQYEIVILGIKYDKSFDQNEIDSLKNVHYLGKKDYSELANYTHYFDVCTIPFLVNEITLSTSPVKLFEYMASGKPIVTTDLPECKKYKSVLVSKRHDEFMQNIELALKLSKDSVYLETLKKEALENTWEQKCSVITSFIGGE